MSSVRHSARKTPEREIRRTMNRDQRPMSRSILEAIRKQHQQMIPILEAIRKQHQQMIPILKLMMHQQRTGTRRKAE